VSDRVRDRGSGRALGSFAGSQPRLARAVYQRDLDLRYLGEGQNRIACQSRLVMRSRSNITCSLSVQLVDWTMPPSI